MRLEKVLTFCVIAAFIVPSINSLSTLGKQITREEAIEISKKSETVKYGLANAYSFSVETKYYNSSKYVPEGHSAWKVSWCFKRSHDLAELWTVGIYVDAEAAKIVYESPGVIYF